jgi:hypothetical protein
LIHYTKGTEVIKAYWQFFNDLVLSLANDTSKVDDDLFTLDWFENEIYEVNLFSHTYFLVYFF